MHLSVPRVFTRSSVCVSSLSVSLRATRLFCDVYNPQSKTYCKRLQVLCPEHSRDPKVCLCLQKTTYDSIKALIRCSFPPFLKLNEELFFILANVCGALKYYVGVLLHNLSAVDI